MYLRSEQCVDLALCFSTSPTYSLFLSHNIVLTNLCLHSWQKYPIAIYIYNSSSPCFILFPIIFYLKIYSKINFAYSWQKCFSSTYVSYIYLGSEQCVDPAVCFFASLIVEAFYFCLLYSSNTGWVHKSLCFLSQIISQTKFFPKFMAKNITINVPNDAFDFVIFWIQNEHIKSFPLLPPTHWSVQGDCFTFAFGIFWIQG